MEKIIKWPAIFFKSIECLTLNFDIVLVNYLGRQRVIIHFAQRLNLAKDHASAREHRLLQ